MLKHKFLRICCVFIALFLCFSNLTFATAIEVGEDAFDGTLINGEIY